MLRGIGLFLVGLLVFEDIKLPLSDVMDPFSIMLAFRHFITRHNLAHGLCVPLVFFLYFLF